MDAHTTNGERVEVRERCIRLCVRADIAHDAHPRLRRHRHHKQHQRRPQIRVEDPPPVAAHLDGVDRVLDVELVEAEDRIPHAHPHVAGDDEGRVGVNVGEGAGDEGEHRDGASHIRKLAAHQGPLGDADDERGGGAEDDEGLDVGELERFDVGEDAREEGRRDREEGHHLVVLDLVDLDETEHADKLDGDPRAGDLREEDKGRRGEVVHRELVDDEPARIEEV